MPSAYPEHGDPWQVSKLYYTMWSRARVLAMHEKFLELGLESPFGDDWFKRPSQEQRITTSIPLFGRHADVRGDAAQGPRHPGRPDLAVLVRPARPRSCARSTPTTTTSWPESLVDSTIPEDDLFAGLR